jgi:phosphatidylinositol-3-phosphatase
VNERLRRIRFSRLQLAVLGALSVLASALIISSALGRSPAQTAALVALRQRPVVYRIASPSAPAATPAPASTPSPDTTAASTPTSSASDTSTSADTTSDASGTDTGDTSTTPTSGTTASSTDAKVKHVYVIALSTPGYAAAFGRGSVATYLNGTLRRQGTLLSGYRSLGGDELPDYLAMVSGQGPNPDTAAGCSTYAEFPTGASAASDGLVSGSGCVYPDTALTIGDQVTAAGQTWKAYIGGMGSACVHPNSNSLDEPPAPGSSDQYDTRHNPFIYFHSLLDLGGCSENDVSIDELPHDLHKGKRTPRYLFIAPDACLDASAQTCPGGTAAGLAGEDAFLHRWVPQILSSSAYKHSGLLIIAFALSSTTANGAGRAGALVISPFTPRHKTIRASYNAYSLLHSVEKLLGYKALGHAASAKSFADAVIG